MVANLQDSMVLLSRLSLVLLRYEYTVFIDADGQNRFWHRLPQASTQRFRRRFLQRWVEHVGSIAQQAEHRSVSRILDLDAYFALRRLTIATHLIYLLIEHDMDIPDDVREHPILLRLETAVTDLVIISNVSCFVSSLHTHLLTLPPSTLGRALVQQRAGGWRRRTQSRHGHYEAVQSGRPTGHG